MTDPAKLRADRKVAWMLAVEDYLTAKITTSRYHAQRMVEHAATQYGPASYGRDWLERWFFIELPPERAAWNVASLFWGWKPTEPHETPEETEASFHAQVTLADEIIDELTEE